LKIKKIIFSKTHSKKLIMKTKQIEIPLSWGSVKGQIFGDPLKKNSIPILALHGYLDNSNRFFFLIF
jgi:hypothetical protein